MGNPETGNRKRSKIQTTVSTSYTTYLLLKLLLLPTLAGHFLRYLRSDDPPLPPKETQTDKVGSIGLIHSS